MNPNQPQATKADILIADKQPENLRQLSSTLTDRGYKVRRAISGQQALDECHAAPPTLILLDIRLPDISGYEICQRLKASEQTRDIPVIFLSALDAAFDKVRAFAAGGADYITKPVQVQEVLVRIEYQLKIRNLQKQLSEQNAQLQQEIIERKRTEAALRREEEKFAKAFHCSPNLIALNRLADGRYLEVNDTFLSTFGYTRSQVIGSTPSQLNILVNPEECAKFDTQLLEFGRASNQEIHLRTCSGEVRTLLLSAELIEMGGETCVLFVSNDITQRVRAEEALRESEAKNRALLNAIPDLIFCLSRDGTFLDFKAAETRKLCVPSNLFLGRKIYEVMPAPIAQQFLENIARTLETGDTQSFDYQLAIGDFICSYEARLAVSGSQEVIVLVRDITERVRTESRLRLLERGIDASSNGIVITDSTQSENPIIYVNKGFERLTGYSAEEVTGQNSRFLQSKDRNQPGLQELRQAIKQQRECAVTLRNYRKDGTFFWNELSVSPVRDESGKVTQFIGVQTDITDRVQAEMALRESEERFRQIAENVREVFFIISPKADRMLYISSAYEDIWGRSCSSLYQHPQSWVESIHPADFPNTIAAFQTQLQTAEEFSQEYRIIRPDGEIRWIWARSFPICDETGRVYRLTGIAEDITNRVLAEQTLQNQKELLQTIFDHIPVMVIFYSPEGEMLLLNREVERVLGWSQANLGECDLQAESYPDPEYRQQVLDFMLAATGEWRDMKTRTRTGRIVDTSWANIRLSDGSRIGIGQDITARKQTEQALRESEARFQKLAANIPGVIYEFVRHPDGSTAFEYISSACREILEVEPEQVLENASLCFDPIHPDDLQGVSQGTEISAQTLQPFACEWRTLTPSGKLKWVQAKSRPERRDSGEIVWYGVLFDISDRKRAEIEIAAAKAAVERLLQRMLLLKQLTEQIRQSLEFQQIIETAATQIGQAFGVSRCLIHTYITQPAPQIFVVAEYLIAGWNSMRDMAIPVVGNPHAEVTVAQDKAVVSADVYAEPLLKSIEPLCHQFGLKSMAVVRTSYQGEPNGVIGLQQCDRFRHWSEEEIELLEAVAAQLGIAIAQARLLEQEKQQRQELTVKNSALEQARREAEAANIAKSRFLSHMSHELRTPLNAILGFTQVMARDSLLSAQHQEHLRIISRSGEHLLSLINDVLEMSKIEAGRLELCENDFDLFDLLDTLEQMFKLKANSKGIALTFNRAPDVPQYVLSDESKLRQVLINLLGNAIKFTQKGSVTLRVRLGHGASGIGHRASGTAHSASGMGHGASGTEQNNQSPMPNPKSPMPSAQCPMPSAQCPIIFEISDTGPGIAPEEMDSLFEAFGQTDTGRNSQEGTGLGLPISRQFVRLMGGEITVSSTLGRGTTFTFDIRVGLAEVAKVQTRGSARRALGLAPGQPPCRILVVEDRAESRMLLVEMLTSLGFEVRSAVNGQEAIAAWSIWQPHLIWMDMRMPVMDGYEATKQIKAAPEGEDTVIIALTASAFEEERAIILQAGCDDFLRKPFREEVLLAKIAEHLGVGYIYEDQPASPQQAAVPVQLTPQDLAVMPAEWVAQLRQAALCADDELIFPLLEQIPKENATLARALADLVSNFRFDRLAHLTQPAL
jgi:PAS domain S-box-containing protein